MQEEDNIFTPSKKASAETGFSIKVTNSGMQVTPASDSLNPKEANSEVDSDYEPLEKPLVIQRVNDGSDDSRVRTGITGFDELIGGGFERESIVLAVGASGTGKTILSMQFLYKGITEYDEPGVLISFEEERESLFKHALQFGWDFAKLEKEDKFRLLVFKPHQITKILEEGGGQVRDALAEIGAKRVVVDSITAYGLLFRDEYKRREKILEFFNLLRKWGITAMIVCEDSPKVIETIEGSIGFISDAVISMYYEQDQEKGIRIHSLEVLKMRGTKHTNKVCAINFEKDGITVYPDVEVF
ncbi:MAG: ATPase domain-containing protein [archaeon]|jgi:circadian clock protein KaiC